MVPYTTYAANSTTNNDERWIKIELKDKDAKSYIYFDKDTLEYSPESNIFSVWIKFCPSQETLEEKRKESKDYPTTELCKSLFHPKDRKVNIDAEYYDYDVNGKLLQKGTNNRFETIIPGSTFETIFNTTWAYYQQNHKNGNNTTENTEDILKTILKLPSIK